jgi:hypothetical protein
MSTWGIVSRAASLLVAVFYLSLLISQGGVHGLLMGLVLLLPLGLIWFPEQAGNAMGFIGRAGWVSAESPPWLVSFMGWFFLIGFPVLIAVLSR